MKIIACNHEALAKELGAARQALDTSSPQHLAGFTLAVTAMIAVLQRDNPRFDQRRFHAALSRHAAQP